MRILAIDYGRAKAGVALATSSIAQPYEVIKYGSLRDLLRKLDSIIEKEKIEELVVGISEGAMGEEARKFGKKLKTKFELPVHFQDETLTTVDAQRLALESGMKKEKRKKLEDAFSAALILQSFLDS
jgi:putative Holliday junction resolvase